MLCIEPNRLPRCKYGTSCYRKNPQHFAEYAHPTDHNKQLHQSSSPMLRTEPSHPLPTARADLILPTCAEPLSPMQTAVPPRRTVSLASLAPRPLDRAEPHHRAAIHRPAPSASPTCAADRAMPHQTTPPLAARTMEPRSYGTAAAAAALEMAVAGLDPVHIDLTSALNSVHIGAGPSAGSARETWADVWSAKNLVVHGECLSSVDSVDGTADAEGESVLVDGAAHRGSSDVARLSQLLVDAVNEPELATARSNGSRQSGTAEADIALRHGDSPSPGKHVRHRAMCTCTHACTRARSCMCVLAHRLTRSEME